MPLAWVARVAGTDALPKGSTVLITLSGRGDKDVAQVAGDLRTPCPMPILKRRCGPSGAQRAASS